MKVGSDDTHRADPTLASAVDLGTNSALLLVGRLSASGDLEVTESACATPRLGEGVARAGRLLPAAVERTLAVLADFAGRIEARGVPATRRRAVATAVLRMAADAAAFVRAARERCGIEIEVLSAAEEARLGYRAALASGCRPDAPILDVGGGSTDLIWDSGRRCATAPVGAVVLDELAPDLESRLQLAREACVSLPEGIARCRGPSEPTEVVVLGGTAANLASLEIGARRFDPSRIEGIEIDAGAASRWAARLSGMPLSRRLDLPIEPDRASILPAGLACLAAALERVGASRIRVSGKGIRYGVLDEILHPDRRPGSGGARETDSAPRA